MAHRTATLNIIPRHLADALQFTLTLTPNSEGQRIAQREMATSLEAALDARRQRILISQSQVGNVKWLCLFVQAACVLFAIALVHSDNRVAAIIMLTVFATGVAACVLVILAYDRPFIGQLAISPNALLQVMPEAESSPAALGQTVHRLVQLKSRILVAQRTWAKLAFAKLYDPKTPPVSADLVNYRVMPLFDGHRLPPQMDSHRSGH
jgi:hypothetical protein